MPIVIIDDFHWQFHHDDNSAITEGTAGAPLTSLDYPCTDK